MSEDEQYDTLVDVWSEVKLLTGALLYEGKMLEIQLEMLRKFLALSDFGHLTKDEVLQAFYLNAAGQEWKTLPHYGREINGEWVGAVLGAFMKFRNATWEQHGEGIRKALADPAPERPKPGHIPDSFWRSEIQKDLERLRAGQERWIFNSGPKRRYLRRLGAIAMHSRQHWKDGIWLSIKMLAQDLNNPHCREFRQLLRGEQDYIHRPSYREAVDEMRKRQYLDFLKLLRDTAIVNIWQDIDFS